MKTVVPVYYESITVTVLSMRTEYGELAASARVDEAIAKVEPDAFMKLG